MRSIAQVIGVDPGLVDTGVVSMLFDETHRTITVRHTVVKGPDVGAAHDWIKQVDPEQQAHVFIEKYIPRQRLNTDDRMVKAEQSFALGLANSTLVRNTGSKQTVKPTLMELLGVWRFATSTHHQDLRSAARIALYGMMKVPSLNAWLADIVRDTIEGKPWRVQ